MHCVHHCDACVCVHHCAHHCAHHCVHHCDACACTDLYGVLPYCVNLWLWFINYRHLCIVYMLQRPAEE